MYSEGHLFIDVPEGTKPRTPREHPYSYDSFMLWGFGQTQGAQRVYSDRMGQWDHVKNDACLRLLPRGGWREASPEQASAAMTEYYGKPTRVVGMAQGCNAANGNPHWIIWIVQ